MSGLNVKDSVLQEPSEPSDITNIYIYISIYVHTTYILIRFFLCTFFSANQEIKQQINQTDNNRSKSLTHNTSGRSTLCCSWQRLQCNIPHSLERT